MGIKVKVLGTRDESAARARERGNERPNTKLVRLRMTTKEMLDQMREKLGITVIDIVDLMVTKEYRDPKGIEKLTLTGIWEEWKENGVALSPVQKWIRQERIVWETLYQETPNSERILRIKLFELVERLVPDRISKAQVDKMLMNLHRKKLVKYCLPDEVWIADREETHRRFLVAYPPGS